MEVRTVKTWAAPLLKTKKAFFIDCDFDVGKPSFTFNYL